MNIMMHKIARNTAVMLWLFCALPLWAQGGGQIAQVVCYPADWLDRELIITMGVMMAAYILGSGMFGQFNLGMAIKSIIILVLLGAISTIMAGVFAGSGVCF